VSTPTDPTDPGAPTHAAAPASPTDPAEPAGVTGQNGPASSKSQTNPGGGNGDPTDPAGGGRRDPAVMPYTEALAELEGILGELERDDVDVDQLAAHVARAAALIEACRLRIDTARVDVERIVAPLGGVGPS
jgi:exodeoxyribonuclease VII small subunit